MFRFQRARGHAAIAHLSQLIGDLIQHTRPIGLRTAASIPVSFAQLFQLVVQVSHRVLSYLVSVYDQPQARSLSGSAEAEGSGDTTPRST